MFEVASKSQGHNLEEVTDQTVPSSRKRAKPKTKPKTKPRDFADLANVVSSWEPSDDTASRRLLANELQILIEEREYSCVKACIPAIVVDKQYPIDLMHYKTEEDINELMARMLWMHQEFNSAISIFLGVPDEETAAKVEDAYESLMATDDDCVIIMT